MSVEPLETVIRLWESGQITADQAIGKVLLWLSKHQKWLSELKVALRRFDNEARRNKGK